ncbi:MAG: EcsC family protein [Methylotetracoccus sp.]|jgi:hypothetical protein|nr:EcsC family protein [Methylotetracoccus sp.]
MKSHEDHQLLDEEIQELRWAHTHLEHPSFASRLGSVIGVPIERTLKLLPQSWYRAIHVGAGKSIERAAHVAIKTLGDTSIAQARQAEHLGLAAFAGALGGFAGPLGLLVELPVMTVLMLRSIAGIACAQGEDLGTVDTRLACVEVFGLGARSRDDDGAETGYYGIRSTLAFHFGGALGSSGISAKNLPAGMDVLRGITARFGVAVSDEVAARMIPVVGALGGATLNLIFMQHFQNVAKGHFIVRRLERKHGSDVIRVAYGDISRQEEDSAREYSPLEGW